MRFQWLTRKKRGAGGFTNGHSRRPIQLLCLEERNSASALYGMEGLVLFSSGSSSATMRVHRPLVDEKYGSSFLPSNISETPESNLGGEFSQSSPERFQNAKSQRRITADRSKDQPWGDSEFASTCFGGALKLDLLDRLYATDKPWLDSVEEDESDSTTRLWNSFRDKTLAAIRADKAGSSSSISHAGSLGSEALAGSDPYRAGQALSLAFTTSSPAAAWGGAAQNASAFGGGGRNRQANNGNDESIMSAPAADLGTNLQNPDPSKSTGNLEGTQDRGDAEAEVDTAADKLEVQPEKDVTIGPVAPGSNPSSTATVAAFPAPTINAVVNLPAGGTGFSQAIGVAPGGSVFGTSGIVSRMDLPPARVSAAPASADLASASMHVGPNRTDTAAANGHAESSGGTLDSQSVLFRINRGSGSAHDLQVRYTLKTFDSGTARTVERTAFLAAGQNQLLVVAGEELAGTSPEVATLSVASGPGYQAANGIATRMSAAGQGSVSDGALLEAYRMGGSQDAFDTLVKQYWPGVFRTCHRILGQWADAEDVSQFVFLALTQMQMRFPPPLARWLNRVARNASIGLLRSKKRRERREQIAAKGDLTDSEESAFMAAEVIGTALEQLPDPLREAVSLRYLDGWSQQEAAQIVGCPRGTLSQRAAHGITRLRTMLTRDSA